MPHQKWSVIEVGLKLASIECGTHDDYLQVPSVSHYLHNMMSQ